MKPSFFVLLACVAAAALTGGVVAQESTPRNGTAPTATENPASTDSGSTEVATITATASTTSSDTRTLGASEGTAPTPTENPDSTDSGSTEAPDSSSTSGSGATSLTPDRESTDSASGGDPPSTANVTSVATLDNSSIVTDYRMKDGLMLVDVVLEKETTISGTERIEKEGAYEVSIQDWSDLQPGNHTLTFETMSNESASVMFYTQRGLDAGRAIELRIDDSEGFVSGTRRSDPYVVGFTVSLLLGLMFLGEAVRRKFALGEGGERLV